ncbi:hypothetical protein HDU79_002850 [Rhizoclosmatium sp. JEL0117]|nr:hypothetical protein HDU79_002850 [Rhizoclosmatium sp. JEL0117]
MRTSSRIGLSRRSVLYEDHDDAGLSSNEVDVEDASPPPLSINAQRNGLRAWYPDYSSIDWIHDSLKERVRVRALRSLPGWLGALACTLDSLQGWTLLFLLGLSVGAIASFIDVTETILLSWRDGYCSTNIWDSRELCCQIVRPSPPKFAPSSLLNPFGLFPFPAPLPYNDCKDWIPWSTALGPTLDYWLYASTAVLFAFLAVLVTNLSKVVRVNAETGKTSVKYQAAGGGIAEVKTILGGFVIRRYLGFKTMICKMIGLIFCTAAGILLGQQGPLVHISCCIGNIYSRFFLKYAKNEGKRREILSAASAAGVSVAFAAPIGGVLFSLEEVSYYFPMKTMWRSFFCSLMAAMTLKVLNPYGSGKLVKFQTQYSHDWKDFELVPFALLGVLGGIYGGLFIKITNFWAGIRKSKNYPFHPVVEVVVIALVTALVNQRNALMRLSLNEIKEVLFSECIPGEEDVLGLCNTEDINTVIAILLSLLVFKTLLVFFSFGIRAPGGIVGSSMLVGALFGRIVGEVILELQLKFPEYFPGGARCIETNDCVTPGIYALVGGATALCGVTRMTVSLVVIMVELTGALKLTLPLMVGIMVAKWTGDLINKDSQYDSTIKRNDYPYLDHKRDHHPQRGKPRAMAFAGDVAEYDYDASFQIGKEYSWDAIQEKLRLLSFRDDGGFAVLADQTLIGYIAFQDVKYATTAALSTWPTTTTSNGETCLPTFYFKDPTNTTPASSLNLLGVDLSPWMDQAPLTVSNRASMDLVLELFMKVGCKTVCVVEGGTGGSGGQYAGILDKKRVIAWLREG